MKSPRARRLLSWSFVAILVCAWQSGAPAEPIPVRHVEGTVHGFLLLRSEEGHVIAAGDLVQVVHGDRITSHLLFRFKDGSTDDETTVFSQRRNFQLITDRHIQKGPSYPNPMDLFVDCHSGKVTVRTTGKDGKEEVKTDQVKMPPDLANGLVLFIIRNIRPETPETKVSMLVAAPKPRLIKLAISPRGEEPFSIAGSSQKAIHYEIKIEIGGVPGLVAPLIGKQPPNIQAWIIGGQAPTFVKEEGPFYLGGPTWTIELTSPIWPDSRHSSN